MASAKLLLQEGYLKDSLSRSYYSMFSAVRALLSLKGLDSSKHSDIISLFNQHFIKEGIIDPSCGRLMKKAQLSRQRSDYGDYILVTSDEAKTQIENAEKLIVEIKRILIQEIGLI